MASYLTNTVLKVKSADPGSGWSIVNTPIGAQAVYSSDTGSLVVSLIASSYTNIELYPGRAFTTAGIRIVARGVIPATSIELQASITIDQRVYNIPIVANISQSPNSDPVLALTGSVPFTFTEDLLSLTINGMSVSNSYINSGIARELILSRTQPNSVAMAMTVNDTPAEKIDTTNILDIFNKPECGVGPVSPIEPEPEVVPCPEVIDPPVIDPENPPIPIPPIIPIIPPPIPGPPGDDGTDGQDGDNCQTQVRWTYSTVYKCADPPVKMMVQQISKCVYWVHITFYTCPPHHNNKPCCQYIWCDPTWEPEQPPTTEPPISCTYACRWVWLYGVIDDPTTGDWKLDSSCQDGNQSLCTCGRPSFDGTYHGQLQYMNCVAPDPYLSELGPHIDSSTNVSGGRWALKIDSGMSEQSNYDYCVGKTPPAITGRFPGELITVCECEPAPVGACCYPSGYCEDGLTQSECEAGGGTYQGDDSVCEDVTCPTTTAAPTTTTTTTTTSPPPTTMPPGTTTTTTTTTTGSPTSPPNFGICCDPNGECITYVDEPYCDSIGGQFHPGLTDCLDADCQQPSSGCSSADCILTWSAVDGMWLQATNNCTPGCRCSSPGPGAYDGQTITIPCEPIP